MTTGLVPVSLDAFSAWCRFVASGGEPPTLPDGREAQAALASVLLANRLGPPLDRALERHAARLPAAFVETVRADARVAAERGLAAIASLHAVAAALETASVPWLLWKGPALAAQVWGEPTRRHFTDLDVVVAPASRRAARAALARAGWRASEDLPPRTERAVRAREAAFPLVRPDATLVELHWAFAPSALPQPLDPEEVLARAETVRVGAVCVRTPADGDALVLLASHATKHGWSQAEEVISFARLASRRPGALDAARAVAARAGTPHVVALAEQLSARLLGAEWALSPTAAATDLGRMTAACLHRMCAGDAAWRETHEWTMSWMSRRADRARYLVGALLRPTPQEPRWLRLPDALAGAYPAVRIARLALRALGVTR